MELLCTNANCNRHRNVAFDVGNTMHNNDASGEKSKRQRVSWSGEETAAVISGYNRHRDSNSCWIAILRDKEFQKALSKRTNTQLKDKIIQLKNKNVIR
jgi:hypothetical protein